MTGKKLQRVLACLLAVLLLSQVGAFSPAVFAADDSSYTLQDGTAIIPEGASEEKVNQILTRTLVAGFDEMSKEDQNSEHLQVGVLLQRRDSPHAQNKRCMGLCWRIQNQGRNFHISLPCSV